MSDDATTAEDAEATVTEESEPKPTETVEFWKQKAREHEKRSRENYAAVKRLAELEESQKSEAEKIADRLAKADSDLAAIPSRMCELLKPLLIKQHGLDPDKDGQFLTATEPDLLVEQADRLAEISGKRKNIVPREGRTPNQSPVDPTRDFLRSINGQ
jgi:hypothetical protein